MTIIHAGENPSFMCLLAMGKVVETFSPSAHGHPRVFHPGQLMGGEGFFLSRPRPVSATLINLNTLK